MISDSIRNEINLAVVKKFDLNQEPIWKHIDKGFINNSFEIIGEKKEPLAICKVYSEEEEIYRAKQRFEREEFALEIFGGLISPEIIWKKEGKIIVYNYVAGNELLHLQINDETETKLKEVIEQIHRISKKKMRVKSDEVTNYYKDIISSYKKSEIEYPNKLIEELESLTHKQLEILDQFQENLTYVHGDLVPPNFIFNGKQFALIDWEFFRPELSFFDRQYFNYYARAHKIPVKMDVEKKVQNHYYRLVDVLEKLWRYGFFQRKKEIH